MMILIQCAPVKSQEVAEVGQWPCLDLLSISVSRWLIFFLKRTSLVW